MLQRFSARRSRAANVRILVNRYVGGATNSSRVPGWLDDMPWSGLASDTCEFRTQSIHLGLCFFDPDLLTLQRHGSGSSR